MAQSLFLSNTNIVLPPGQRTTLSKTFTVSQDVQVFLLSSHMHERGERFVVRINGGQRSGEIVFQTTSWSSPDIGDRFRVLLVSGRVRRQSGLGPGERPVAHSCHSALL